MADSDILLNGVSVAGGQLVATFQDASNLQHEKVITEFIDGTGQPIMVSASNPLPVYGRIVVSPTGVQNVNVVGNDVGLATGAKQDTGNATLATINTTLGSPFQAGGSIGNTAFGINQGGIAVSSSNPLNVTGIYGGLFVYGKVQGNIPHGVADSGNPLKVGNKAIAFGANPTAVASGDRTDAYANVAGIPFVLGGHPNIITFEAAYTSAQTDTAIVTVSTGNKIVVTEIEALCDNANTVNVSCRVGFGTASTPTTTGVVLTHPGIAPGSGVVRGNGGAIVGVGADNEDLRATISIPTGGSIRILVSYFTISV